MAHWEYYIDLFHVLPQGFQPTSRSWKRIFHIHVEPVRKRGVPGVNETPNEQCFRRRSNVLYGGNSMAVGIVIVTYGLEKAYSLTAHMSAHDRADHLTLPRH